MTSHSAIRHASLRQSGFTLVEIMVAITLSLLLLAGVLQIFLSSKTTYTVQEGLSRLQENARFALGTLSQNVRMAGYPGCMYLGNVAVRNIATPAPPTFTPDTSITGLNDVASGTTYGGVNVIAGTDVIVVRGAVNTNTPLTAKLATAASPIVVASNPTGIAAGNILLISDCNSADMFKVSAVTGTGPFTIAHSAASNTSASFLSAYNTNAQLMTYTSTTYFVGNTTRTNLQGTVIPALFRTTMAGVTEELVEGVENMQLEYGLDDTNNDQTADKYVTAASITAANWHKVVSLRLNLLVNSIDAVSPTPVTFTFNGVTTTDRLLRRDFLTVINLRNNSQ